VQQNAKNKNKKKTQTGLGIRLFSARGDKNNICNKMLKKKIKKTQTGLGIRLFSARGDKNNICNKIGFIGAGNMAKAIKKQMKLDFLKKKTKSIFATKSASSSRVILIVSNSK
jgi:hypothetical protein